MAPPRGRPLTRSGMLNQFAGGAISTATGFAIGSVIAPTLAPLTQELLNETWSLFPNRPLSLSQSAEASARGLVSPEAAQEEAKNTGYSGARFKLIEGLAANYPPPEEVLALWNRKEIDEGKVDTALERSGMPEPWRNHYKRLRQYLPSVSDLIRWGVREVFTPSQRDFLDLDAEYPPELGRRLAEQGYSDEDARNAWAGHWELPSATQMAQMRFRNELSEPELQAGLKALDYAPTWRAKLSTILRPIPSLSDMIRFAVREVYDDGKRRSLGLDAEFPQAFADAAAMHGFDEEYAKQEWAAHWRLPSATQGYHMLWRGEINEAELDGLLKALDYPLLWRDRLANIARLVPGRIDLRRMFAAGVIERSDVYDGYMKLGYTAKDAETLTEFAVHLAQSGPTVHQKWADRARSSLFTVTHAEYLDESLDRQAAEASLDIVGVPQVERAAIFASWDREREIKRLELTPAQIKKAYKKGLWTEQEALDELVTQNMLLDDAQTFLQS